MPDPIPYEEGKKYIVTAPNADYTGQTEGLEISKGRGVIDSDPRVFRNLADPDRTAAETLERIQQHSPEYHVEALGGNVFTVPDMSHLRDENGNLRTKKSKKGAEPTED